jgi:hypothetical protein
MAVPLRPMPERITAVSDGAAMIRDIPRGRNGGHRHDKRDHPGLTCVGGGAAIEGGRAWLSTL